MLDRIYLGAGILAAIFLVTIAVMVLAQIFARLAGTTAPGADQFAGYSLSASSFLALAYTLRHDAHIRVSLLIERLTGRVRTVFEIWCLSIATLMTSYFAYYAIAMTWRSYELQEQTIGLVPIPIWIPQTGMAIGVTLLAISFLEALVTVLCGGTPNYARNREQDIDERASASGS